MTTFFSLLVTAAASFLSAQNIGVDYFKTGEYEIAKDIFNKELSQNPAEANYYLGEIAYAKGDLNGAKAYYEKGLAASPDYVLNNVGLGKVLLKSNPKAADDEFSKAVKKDKKNVEVLIAVAEAYYKNGNTEKMEKYLEDARKADKKSPLIYVFQGDMKKDANDIGGAAGEYEMAVNFDPNYAVAYLKISQVYSSINPTIAIDRLTRVLELRPDYVMANKYLGNIYYQNGQYKKAIDAYGKFFAQGEYSVEDLTRYAASLYFDERYDDASKLIQEGIQKDPNNFVLNRLLMYSALETKDYAKGLSIAERFFVLPKGEKDEYIARDYMTYAKLLSENDQFDKALSQYEHAIKLDSTQIGIYKEVAETLANSGQTANAGNYYKKYIEAAGDKAEALDYFNMGRYYYMAAGTAMKDSTDVNAPVKMKNYLAEADTAFAIVGQRIPDSHLGFLFRARTNSLLDPTAEQGLAKPHYEKTIEVIMGKEDSQSNSRELLEAYKYLSYYYYVQYDKTKSAEDKANTILYSEKMLELDPANAVAKQLLDALK
ncbi:MAG: tetratricopeptide repeat protein [Dysgonomonas sp.]